MSERAKLDDNMAMAATGGISKRDDFGDGSRVAFCPTGSHDYQHYYNKCDESYINEIIRSHNDPNLTDEENDMAAFEEIVASPYAFEIPR